MRLAFRETDDYDRAVRARTAVFNSFVRVSKKHRINRKGEGKKEQREYGGRR